MLKQQLALHLHQQLMTPMVTKVLLLQMMLRIRMLQAQIAHSAQQLPATTSQIAIGSLLTLTLLQRLVPANIQSVFA